jgi:multidrug transporter EmrE-like cation transporter
MAWVYLLMAGLFEVGYASTMKLSEGFTKVGRRSFSASASPRASSF